MRVVVADDNDVWRPSLVSALASRGITVVAEAADGPELLVRLGSITDGPVDVAILDLRMPPTWSDEGMHLARSLRNMMPGIGVIILSGYEQDVQLHYATQALSDLEGSGGLGYLFKDRTNRNSLQDAVTRVAAGRLVVDPMFASQAADEYRSRQDPSAGFTNREVEVLDLLVQGMTNKEIADTLHLSTAVIERHLTSIFREILPSGPGGAVEGDSRRENRRVLTVLEWLRRTGRLNSDPF